MLDSEVHQNITDVRWWKMSNKVVPQTTTDVRWRKMVNRVPHQNITDLRWWEVSDEVVHQNITDVGRWKMSYLVVHHMSHMSDDGRVVRWNIAMYKMPGDGRWVIMWYLKLQQAMGDIKAKEYFLLHSSMYGMLILSWQMYSTIH